MSVHPELTERAKELAAELTEALDDPRRGEWGGYPWEHLGDAERDVRVLLAALVVSEQQRERLREDRNALVNLADHLILEATEHWHESGVAENRSLHEYLGLSWEDYCVWANYGVTTLARRLFSPSTPEENKND